jgi:hypothetical protein
VAPARAARAKALPPLLGQDDSDKGGGGKGGGDPEVRSMAAARATTWNT